LGQSVRLFVNSGNNGQNILLSKLYKIEPLADSTSQSG